MKTVGMKNNTIISVRVLLQVGKKLLKVLSVIFFTFCYESALANSDVVGSDGGSISVGNAGEAAWTMPIEVPSGINGVSPKLTLSVSSAGGNGALGVGGSLSGLSSITRCGKTVHQDGYFQAPQFVTADAYCLDGARLVLSKGNQGEDASEYRTQIESFQRIRAFGNVASKGPDYFEVTNRNGAKLFYGRRASTKDIDGVTGAVAVWKIDKLVDSNRNTLHYHYANVGTDNEVVLTKITYGGNESQNVQENLSVELEYQDRPDKTLVWSRGQQYGQTKRISRIKSKVGNTTIKDYWIGYQLGEVSQASKIASIKLCGMGGNDGTQDCYRPSTFHYEPEIDGNWQNSSTSMPSAIMSADGKPLGTIADINNDGRSDWVIAYKSVDGQEIIATHLGTPSGWQASSEFSLPRVLFDYSLSTDGVATGLLLDINGDGWPDFAQAYKNDLGETILTWANNGGGFESNSELILPTALISIDTNGDVESLAEVTDINADGLVDVIASVRNSNGVTQSTWVQKVEVENGGNKHSWNINSNFAPPTIGTDYTQGNEGRVFATLQDVNGDGLADWVQSYKADGAVVNSTWLNVGHGFATTASQTWKLPAKVALFNYDFYDGIAEYSFVDVNSDGLPDLSKAIQLNGSNSFDTWLNTGNAWQRDIRYNFPAAAQRINANGKPWTVGGLADLNNDGHNDFILSFKALFGPQHAQQKVWIFDDKTKKWVVTTGLNFPFINNRLKADGTSFASMEVADLDHDGFPELLNLSNSSVYKKQNLGANRYPGKLKKTVNSLGGVTELNYRLSTDASVYGLAERTAYPNVAQNSPILLVSEVSSSNGIGGMISARHWYGQAKTNLTGQGGLGYAKKVLIDVNTNVKVHTLFHQTYPYAGKIKGSIKTLNDAVILSSSSSTMQLLDMDFEGAVTQYPHPDTSIAKTYDLEGNLLKVVESQSDIDAYGNSTSSVQKAYEVSGTTKSLLRRSTQTIQYKSPDFDRWLLGLPVSTTNEVHDPIKGQTFTNNSTATFFADGKPKTETLEPNSNQSVTTAYRYDAFGNRISTTVTADGISGSRENRIVFSENGRFPISASNALGHTVTTEFDQYLGKPLSITDANGIIKEFAYDGFGTKLRESKKHQSNAATRGMQIAIPKWCDDSPGQCPRNAVYYVAAINDEGDAPEAAYYDINGRELRKQTYGSQSRFRVKQYRVPINGQFPINERDEEPDLIVVDTEYDENGRVVRVTQPYYVNIHTKQPTSRDSAKQTTFQYDILGRQTRRINAEGDIFITQYRGLDVITANPGRNYTAPQITKVTNSIFGQPIESVDADGNSTKYEYDARGKLVKTTDAKNNVATINYDPIFGRKIAMNDPDLGIWRYQYDSLGNMVAQTDANGFVTRMRYDKLNRLVWRTDGDRAGGDSRAKKLEETRWAYSNTRANGKLIGALDRVWTSKYSRSYSYDELARVSHINTNIEGRNYAQRTGYLGTQDKIDWIEYPSGLTVRNTYDDYGFPKTVEGITLNYGAYHNYKNASIELNNAQRALEAFKDKHFNLAELNELEKQEGLVKKYAKRLSSANEQYERDPLKKRIEDSATRYSGDKRRGIEGLIERVQKKIEEHRVLIGVYNNEYKVRFDKVKPGQERIKDIGEEISILKGKWDTLNGNRRYHAKEELKFIDIANSWGTKYNNTLTDISNKGTQWNDNIGDLNDEKIHIKNLILSIFKQPWANIYSNDLETFKSVLLCCEEQIPERLVTKNLGHIEQHFTDIGSHFSNISDIEGRLIVIDQELDALKIKRDYYERQYNHYDWKAGNEEQLKDSYISQMNSVNSEIGDLNEEATEINNKDKPDLDLIDDLVPLIVSHNNIVKMYADRARDYASIVSSKTGTYAKREDLRSENFLRSFSNHVSYITCLNTGQPTGRCYATNLVHEFDDNGNVDAKKQAESRARIAPDYMIDVASFFADRRFFCPSYEGYNCSSKYYFEIKQLTKAIHYAQCARLNSEARAKSKVPCNPSLWGQTQTNNSKTFPRFPYLLSGAVSLSGINYPAIPLLDSSAKLNQYKNDLVTKHQSEVERLVFAATRGTYNQEQHYALIIRYGGVLDQPFDPEPVMEGESDPRDFVLIKRGELQNLADRYKALDANDLKVAQLAIKRIFDSKGVNAYRDYYKVVQDKQKLAAELYAEIDFEYSRLTDNGRNPDHVYEDRKKVYWEAASFNAKGQILSARYGNGTSTNWGYDAFGRINNHMTVGATGVIVSNSYRYDALGNLTYRDDTVERIQENFFYDNLNRLVQASLSGAGAETVTRAQLNTTNYEYDELGNITYKSDIRGGGSMGRYSYGAGNAGPHAVTHVSGLGDFRYDAVGNQTSGNGRTIAYNAYNKPISITRGGLETKMVYGPERQLIKQTEQTRTKGLETTHYVSPLFEATISMGKTIYKNNITVAGHTIAVVETEPNSRAATKEIYLHKNHQGSILAVSNTKGEVIERRYYDAFGKIKSYVGLSKNLYSDELKSNTNTKLGFTGHKTLISAGVIHMGGRIFSPVTGRFLSADPHIQSPLNSQSLNRYSYTLNNPLSLVDPSGYFFSKIFKPFKKIFNVLSKIIKAVVKVIQKVVRVIGKTLKKIGQFIKKTYKVIVAVVAVVVVAYFAPQLIPKLVSYAGTAIKAGAITGGITGLIQTGSITGLVEGAFQGAVGAATDWRSAALHVAGFSTFKLVNGSTWASQAINGGWNAGIQNKLRGRSFSNGFKSGAISSFVGNAARWAGRQAIAGAKAVGNWLRRTFIGRPQPPISILRFGSVAGIGHDGIVVSAEAQLEFSGSTPKAPNGSFYPAAKPVKDWSIDYDSIKASDSGGFRPSAYGGYSNQFDQIDGGFQTSDAFVTSVERLMLEMVKVGVSGGGAVRAFELGGKALYSFITGTNIYGAIESSSRFISGNARPSDYLELGLTVANLRYMDKISSHSYQLFIDLQAEAVMIPLKVTGN